MPAKNALDPKLLGFWVRCIRDAQHMSQDALAAAASVDVRTIQRFENGTPVNLTSRRCIARALGYENVDIFDDPAFTVSVYQFFGEIKKFKLDAQVKEYPDRVRVKVEKVLTGDGLGQLAGGSNAILLHADEALSEEAKDAAAVVFDFVRDLMDLGDIPFGDKRRFNKELEKLLRSLEAQGAVVYSALRSVNMVGENWTDKSPMRAMVGYLAVVPAEKQLDEIYAPRRMS